MAASSDGDVADFRNYTWLDHVAAAVRSPRPRSDTELTALLDAAFAQDLSCLVKPLPLRRAPGIDGMVDIDALLISTWSEAEGDGLSGAACALPDVRDFGCASSAGTTQVDCRASSIGELIADLEEGCGYEVDGGRHEHWPQIMGHESLEI